jgi:hypothetical protein
MALLELFPLESAAGFYEGVHRETGQDQSYGSHNPKAHAVRKVVKTVMVVQVPYSVAGKHQEDQTGRLEPERIERSAYGEDKRFSAGKDRVEQPVFLYNALQSIFDSGNLGHCGYCSAKTRISLRKNKTPVTSRASNLGSPEEFA